MITFVEKIVMKLKKYLTRDFIETTDFQVILMSEKTNCKYYFFAAGIQRHVCRLTGAITEKNSCKDCNSKEKELQKENSLKESYAPDPLLKEDEPSDEELKAFIKKYGKRLTEMAKDE